MEDIEEINQTDSLKAVFDASPYAMLIITDGIFVEANRAAFKIFNAKKRSDIIGKPPSILSPENQPDGKSSELSAKGKIERAIAGSHEIFEWQHSTLDGTPFSARVNLLRFNYMGKPSLMVAFEDITEQKKGEDALRIAQKNMETIFDTTPYAMLVIADGVFVEVNKAGLSLFGCRDRKDLIGKSPSVISPEKQSDGTMSDIAAESFIGEAMGGKVVTFDWIHNKLDGTLMDCVVTLAGIQFNGKDSLMTVIQDLTEERRKEREIQTLKKKADWIIDKNPALMFVIDNKQRITKANQAWVDISGYSMKQLLSMYISDFKVSERTGDTIKTALETRSPVSGNFKLESPNGIQYFRYFYIPMIMESGSVDEILGVYFDETDLKKLQITLTSSIEELGDGLAELASKNLKISVPLNPGDPLIKVKENLNDAVKDLRTVLLEILSESESLDRSIKDINRSTEDLAQASSDVASTSQNVADEIDHQREELEGISGNVSDLSASIEEIAASAVDVRDITLRVAKSGSDAQSLGNDATRQMKMVEEVSSTAVEQIRSLNSQMQEINKIVRLISDIASQTNLLALNAAIEAARAGDAGRGFAVVAGEVKNLAGESREATQNIEEVIARLMDGSNKTAESIEKAYDAIVAGIEAVSKTISSLDLMVQDIEVASGNVSEISRATDSQANATNEVNQSIEMVSRMVAANQEQMDSLSANAEESSAATEEIASASGMIMEMVEKLQNKISEFSV